MDGWNTTFLLGRPIFRGYVSFREGAVDGRNRAPVDIENISCCIGFHRKQVVQDFFHRQQFYTFLELNFHIQYQTVNVGSKKKLTLIYNRKPESTLLQYIHIYIYIHNMCVCIS